METAKVRTATLDLESPFLSRGWAWASERFPPVNIVAGFVLYLMTLAMIRQGTSSGSITIYARDFLAAFALVGQFLVLRILDEHKDFEVDRINHPDRALQRGLITLPQLRKLGIGAAALGVGVSLWIDHGIGAATLAWAAMICWTILMAKEFFCREWIRERLFLYAFSHMLITPFAIYWSIRMAEPKAPFTIEAGLLLSLTFISGFAYELARKSRGPEEEREKLDSYSKIIGYRACALGLIAILTTVLCNQLALLLRLDSQLPTAATVAVLSTYVLSLAAAAKYLKDPTARTRKSNEGASGLFMLTNYLSLAILPLASRGIHWS